MEVAPPEAAVEANNQAVKLQADGKYAEADSLYKKSIGILESALGPEHPLVTDALANQASLYRADGHYDEAERVFQIALRIWRKRGSSEGRATPLLSAERIEKDFTLKNYGASVRNLRERVESGDASARQELAKTLERLGPWYHNVVYTPGIMSNHSNPDYPASRWRVLDSLIPKDLRGKSVLDIGCNSGFFSLEMKKRGADRVVGVDIMNYLLAQARFGSHWFNLPLELYECGAYDVRSLESSFDVVVFVGVLYHLKHPLYALEQIASICKDTMYFQSVTRISGMDFEPRDDYPPSEVRVFDHPDWPKLYFIEKKFNGDETNWWFATRSCLKAMLRTAGFRYIQDTSDNELFVCRK